MIIHTCCSLCLKDHLCHGDHYAFQSKRLYSARELISWVVGVTFLLTLGFLFCSCLNGIEAGPIWVEKCRCFMEGNTGKRQGQTPLLVGYRPETDVSSKLDGEQASWYLQLIGILRWAIKLGQIEIL
jgi:hypothetical protein